MSNRSAKFVSAMFAGILVGANFSAIAQSAPAAADSKATDSKPADNCVSAPKGSVPAGSHWYYHLDRATKRQCWYIGEEKNKTAKAAPVPQDTAAPAQDAAAPAAVAAAPAAAPPTTNMRKSVADARAELPSPRTKLAQEAAADAAQPKPADAAVDNSPPAMAPDAGTPPSAISSRWPDAASVSSSNNPQLAAAGPPASAQVDVEPQPAPQPATVPAAVAAPDTSADRQSSSTQLLLMVMAGALALAGLIGAVMLRLSRARKPPYEIRDEWRAPWDSSPADPLPQPAFPRREAPMRIPREAPMRPAPVPIRRAPVSRDPAPRDPRAPDDPDRRIAEMLQRLARTAST